FPYTTLFRSSVPAAPAPASGSAARENRPPGARRPAAAARGRRCRGQGRGDPGVHCRLPAIAPAARRCISSLTTGDVEPLEQVQGLIELVVRVALGIGTGGRGAYCRTLLPVAVAVVQMPKQIGLAVADLIGIPGQLGALHDDIRLYALGLDG